MTEPNQIPTDADGQMLLDIGELLTDAPGADPTQDAPTGTASLASEASGTADPSGTPAPGEGTAAGTVTAPGEALTLVTTPPTNQPAPTPVPATELELARAESAQLRATLAEFMASLSAPAAVPPAQPAVAPVVPQPAEQKPIQLSNFAAVNDIITKLKTPQNFLSAEQLDQLVDNPSLVNTALNGVVSTLVDNFSSIIPAIAASVAHEQILLVNMARDFYDANKDLIPYRDFVSVVSKTVERENPNSSYQDIFNKTATQVRQKLALAPPIVQSAAPESGVKPAFAGVRGAARPAVSGAPVARTVMTEIADLLS